MPVGNGPVGDMPMDATTMGGEMPPMDGTEALD
jgi:hypothetical protein